MNTKNLFFLRCEWDQLLAQKPDLAAKIECNSKTEWTFAGVHRREMSEDLYNQAMEWRKGEDLWIRAGQRWLEEKANESFTAWIETKDGEKYRRSQLGKRPKPPNFFGFHLPEWHYDAVRALGEGDEETFKAIKLQNL